MIRLRRRVINGQPVSSGIVLGTARVILPGQKKVAEVSILSGAVNKEIATLKQAVNATIDELTIMRDSAARKLGGPVAKIFDAQLLIASDSEFLSKDYEQIRSRRRNAGYIYNELVQETTLPLTRSKDPYLRQMSTDIDAVANRVLSQLGAYKRELVSNFRENTIMIGKAFTPFEVLNYRQHKATGFLIAEGGKNSHSALISRSLLLPMVVAPNAWTKVDTGNRIIIDGTEGKVIVNPTDEEWADYQRLRRKQGPALVTRIKRLTEIPPLTLDGKPIEIAANLELPGPIEDILAERKLPVGLYRTEFMYLDGDSFPDEQTQYDYYSRIAEKFQGTSVILRTFDIGSDKSKADELAVVEDNPALGWRGIRSMLDMPAVFKAQIRAILRASIYKNLKILLPMVSDITELDRAKKLIAQSKLELRREGEEFDSNIEIGVMIEVPSAALMADRFAMKVDFMSIGTNDLTQYTMAADRNNAKVTSLYSPLHPSVLKLIRITVEACKKHGIPISICGEVAGDPLALPLFIGLGVDQLSMNPSRIVDLCRLIKRIDSTLVTHLVDSVLSSGSQTAVTRKLQSYKAALEKK